jgi:hypothetical protein
MQTSLLEATTDLRLPRPSVMHTVVTLCCRGWADDAGVGRICRGFRLVAVAEEVDGTFSQCWGIEGVRLADGG